MKIPIIDQSLYYFTKTPIQKNNRKAKSEAIVVSFIIIIFFARVNPYIFQRKTIVVFVN